MIYLLEQPEAKKYYCLFQGLTEAVTHFHGNYNRK